MEPDCYCTHTVDIPLGSIVEIMLTGYTTGAIERFYHPIHIHGNSFFIVSQGHGTYGPGQAPGADPILNHAAFQCVDGDCAQTERTEEPIQYNYENPSKRSTVLVPSGGYAILRFR